MPSQCPHQRKQMQEAPRRGRQRRGAAANPGLPRPAPPAGPPPAPHLRGGGALPAPRLASILMVRFWSPELRGHIRMVLRHPVCGFVTVTTAPDTVLPRGTVKLREAGQHGAGAPREAPSPPAGASGSLAAPPAPSLRVDSDPAAAAAREVGLQCVTRSPCQPVPGVLCPHPSVGRPGCTLACVPTLTPAWALPDRSLSVKPCLQSHPPSWRLEAKW